MACRLVLLCLQDIEVVVGRMCTTATMLKPCVLSQALSWVPFSALDMRGSQSPKGPCQAEDGFECYLASCYEQGVSRAPSLSLLASRRSEYELAVSTADAGVLRGSCTAVINPRPLCPPYSSLRPEIADGVSEALENIFARSGWEFSSFVHEDANKAEVWTAAFSANGSPAPQMA